MIAGKSGATIDQLSAAYKSFVPSNPPGFWRENGASDVQYFLGNRIDAAAKENATREAELAAQTKKDRLTTLETAAKRRPAIAKQVFAVHWLERRLTAAKIRDKWNEAYRKESVGDGTPGREDIKKSAQRGREFLSEHETTATELAGIIGLDLG